jgi:hypothetical protein
MSREIFVDPRAGSAPALMAQRANLQKSGA